MGIDFQPPNIGVSLVNRRFAEHIGQVVIHLSDGRSESGLGQYNFPCIGGQVKDFNLRSNIEGSRLIDAA